MPGAKRGNESKERKKGERGIAAQYVTRNHAVKKLQISLKDFRRLCILKGVFPRDPKKKKFGKNKTYYHNKDIAFLSHEPLLKKFREMKSYLKKFNKAVGRRDRDTQQRLKKRKPSYHLDHLVKERYPSFADALRDVDDPLCMAHLFASLPSGTISSLSAARHSKCQRLCKEFQNYVVTTGCLKKVFVSIKGVYYQAEVQGERITWLAPHKFAQHMPTDVDYRVLSTFLEFYVTLLMFVNFKLYNDAGLSYPPTLDDVAEANDAGLSSLILENLKPDSATAPVLPTPSSTSATPKPSVEESQARLKSLNAKLEEITQKNDTEEDVAHEQEQDEQDDDEDQPQAFNDMHKANTQGQGLFHGLTFFLAREVPQDVLEFTVRSMGGRVVRETCGGVVGKNVKITHHVMDRPKLASVLPSREYVQPQWVFDSLNMQSLLPTAPYGIGVTPPPHLSPFVNDTKEGYVPQQRAVLEAWAKGEAAPNAAGEEEGGDDNEEVVDDLAEEENEEERAFAQELQQEASGVTFSKKRPRDDQAEEAVSGKAQKKKNKKQKQKKQQKTTPVTEEEEAKELAKIMMSKKHKRLYSRMQYGIKQKQDEATNLAEKRKAAAAIDPDTAKPTPTKKRRKKNKTKNKSA